MKDNGRDKHIYTGRYIHIGTWDMSRDGWTDTIMRGDIQPYTYMVIDIGICVYIEM